jgi:hypothetical protein
VPTEATESAAPPASNVPTEAPGPVAATPPAPAPTVPALPSTTPAAPAPEPVELDLGGVVGPVLLKRLAPVGLGLVVLLLVVRWLRGR